MELRHVRYFVAVAEALSFARAARGLHLSQPPLSRQIRALEEELGTALFTRTKRSVRLTPAGAALLPAARRLLGDADGLKAGARRLVAGEVGTLALGFISVATGVRGTWLSDSWRTIDAVEAARRVQLAKLPKPRERLYRSRRSR